MAVRYIPDGYHSVTPYMLVGDVDQLVDFLTAAFGAEEKERVPNQDGKTGHAEMLIGDSYVMMGRAQDEFPPELALLRFPARFPARFAAMLRSMRWRRRSRRCGGTSTRPPRIF